MTTITDVSSLSDVSPSSAGPLRAHPLEVFYGILFAPGFLMEALGAAADDRCCIATYLKVAVAVVVFVALQIPVAMQIGHPVHSVADGVFGSIGGLALTLIQWLGLSLILASTGYVFTARWRMVPLLAALGLAMSPWLLLAPMRLISCGMAPVIQPVAKLLLMGGLSLWALLLAYRGIAAVFRMTAQQAFVLFLMPTLLTVFSVFWLTDFFVSLSRLFS